MPENVQPINYFIKWSRILFNIAHVKHYVLLFMTWDFDLEFSMFLTFSYFWAFTLVSINKIVSFTFLPHFNLKVECKGVLSIFLFLRVWSWSIPYLTILAPSSLLEISGSARGFVFKRKPPKKGSSKRFFYKKQVFIHWFM